MSAQRLEKLQGRETPRASGLLWREISPRREQRVGGGVLSCLWRLLLLGSWMVATSPAILGQVTTATVSGTVRDSSGAVVPGANVVVRNVDSGIARTVPTDSQGRYLAPSLSLGGYELQVEAPGFQREIRRGITLTVDQHAVVDFTLRPGAVAESVTITGDAPLVETTTASVGALVDQAKVRDLPLNGRDFTELSLLQPGVVVYREANRGFVNRGTGIRVSIAGAKANQVSYVLDGLNISNGAGTTPGSATGHNLGVDAIQEFKVLAHNYSAEYGLAAGGVINIVTRGGTNSLHGSLFEFLRNSALDARNFFDVGSIPPFKRNQFGGHWGGPIVRDRTFYFGSYEGLRQRLGNTFIVTVPDADAHAGFLPINGVRTGVGVAPQVRPYLEVWPLPNGRVFPGTGTGEYLAALSTATNEDYVSVRLDHKLTDRHFLTGRYTFDDGRVAGPPQELRPRVPGMYTDGITNQYQYLTLRAQTTISATSVNDASIGFNRSNIQGVSTPTGVIPESLIFVPGFPMGIIELAQLATFNGFNGSTVNAQIFNSFSATENFSRVTGSHFLKLGMSFLRLQLMVDSMGPSAGGRFLFDSMEDLLRARPSQFDSLLPGSTRRGYWRQNVWGFYFQDDVQLRPRLTANLGMRYEFVSTPVEKFGRSNMLRDVVRDRTVTSGPLFENPSLKNFSPRIGLAWDVFGDGKTSVRAGFGIYYDQLTNYYWLQMANSNPPFGGDISQIGGTIPFPNAYQSLTQARTPVTSFQTIEYEAKQPYLIHYTFGLQKQLGSTVFQANYTGTRGNHLTMFYTQFNLRQPRVLADGRLFFAPPDPRINPALTTVGARRLGGSSFYNGLQLQAQRRLQGGAQFQVAYTWSKNINDGDVNSFRTEGFSTVAGQNPFQPHNDRGLSAYDARHTLVSNFTYDLPFLSGRRDLAGQLAGGWQLGGIVTLTSGQPFTVEVSFDNARALSTGNGNQRPDLVPGAKSNPVRPQNADQYLNPRSFTLPEAGFFGNVGRNTLIGPGVANFDFTLVKKFPIRESVGLQFRAEFFNLFNRPNFGVPNEANRSVVGRTGVITSAGRLTKTSTTSRQIQFGLRLNF